MVFIQSSFSVVARFVEWDFTLGFFGGWMGGNGVRGGVKET